MSWLDKIKDKMIIRTGDGNQYTPNWINAKMVAEYNVTEYNFPEVKGTFVDRREPKGRKYDLELYFQGEDHLQQTETFLKSAEDKRYWVVSHPMYDSINCQPISLSIDNTQYNVSKITTTVVETLIERNPKANVIIEDKIDEDNETLQENGADDFENNMNPSSADKNNMKTSIEDFYTTNVVGIEDNTDGQNYFNALNDARSKIDNATSEASQAMRAIQTFIEAPARFAQDVTVRMNMLTRNFETLQRNALGSFNTLQDIPNSFKHIFETMGSSTISNLCLATSLPFSENDYSNRVQVVSSVDIILDYYNRYLVNLDTMQIGNGGNPTDYIPNSATINELNDLVNFTLSRLFDLALNSKQERFLVLEDDSNFVLLAHRLYGLESNDSTIEELMRNNNLGLNAILNIHKGTTITYYI